MRFTIKRKTGSDMERGATLHPHRSVGFQTHRVADSAARVPAIYRSFQIGGRRKAKVLVGFETRDQPRMLSGHTDREVDL